MSLPEAFLESMTSTAGVNEWPVPDANAGEVGASAADGLPRAAGAGQVDGVRVRQSVVLRVCRA